MENLISTTWRADTTSDDATAFAMKAVSGVSIPLAAKAVNPSHPNKLRNLRLALSGLAPGMWASNHLEETRHFTGWNYVAIRAICIQAAQAELSAVVDPEAIRSARMSKGNRHRLLKQLAPGRRKPMVDNDGDGSPDLQPLPRRHPLLQLLRRPNIEQSGAVLRFAMTQQLCLTGSALVWIVRNGLGVPCELYVVPTALATPMPPSHLFPRGSYRVLPLSTFGMVSDDEWNSNGSLGSLLMSGGVLDARDVKAVRWPHPLFPSDGQSPLAAGALQIDVAEQADRARWSAMKHSHRPGFVFSWEENSQPGEEEMDTFRDGFNADNGGSQNTGKHLVLPEGMKAERMDRPPTEMDFANAYGQLRDACLALQGVPPIACGITEAGSYSAYYAALKQFTELTIQPTLNLIAEEWTEALGEYHDDGTGAIEIHLKAKAIEDESLLDSRKSLHISARDITINESRAMSKPPLPPVPWGEAQVGSDIAAQEQQKQQAATQGSMPPGKPPGAPGIAASTPGDDDGPEKQDETHTGTREPPRDAVPGRPGTVPLHLLKGMGPHTFASTQVNFPRHLARPILEFGRKLPASILASEGRETEIHCTVLYGLHALAVEPVATVLDGQPPVRLVLGKLDVFETGSHDVLVIAVQSPDLHRLHQRLKLNLPHTDKYPHYKPHVTIAYLKPGEGKVFKGDPSFEGISLIAGEVIFSAAAGERTAIRLGGPLTKSAQFREEDHPRTDDGKFGSGGGGKETEKPKDKPDPQEPTPRDKWQAEVDRIDADHDAALARYQAQTAKIEGEHVTAFRAWNAECEGLYAANEKAKAAWNARKDARDKRKEQLDSLHYVEVVTAEKAAEKIAAFSDSLTPPDATDTTKSREEFAKLAETLPAVYAQTFLDTYRDHSDGELDSVGLPEKPRERLKAEAEKMANALASRAEKARKYAGDVAIAHQRIESMSEPEFDDTPEDQKAKEEWEHSYYQAELSLQFAVSRFNDALETVDLSWEQFVEKATEARDDAIETAIRKIHDEEDNDDEPEELSEEELPPEPPEPEYPEEPVHPGYPEEPAEEEIVEPEEEPEPPKVPARGVWEDAPDLPDDYDEPKDDDPAKN